METVRTPPDHEDAGRRRTRSVTDRATDKATGKATDKAAGKATDMSSQLTPSENPKEATEMVDIKERKETHTWNGAQQNQSGSLCLNTPLTEYYIKSNTQGLNRRFCSHIYKHHPTVTTTEWQRDPPQNLHTIDRNLLTW